MQGRALTRLSRILVNPRGPPLGKGRRRAKRHRRGAIEALNRNQKDAAIHFFGDGTGERICWIAMPVDQ
jgi:hypothetical protein